MLAAIVFKRRAVMKYAPGLIVFFLCGVALSGPTDLPPDHGIVLDLTHGWQTSGGPQTGLVGSKTFHMELTPPTVKFTIPEPDARYNWRMNLTSTIDPAKFPIFTFTYRATNLNTASNLYLLRTSAIDGSGVNVVKLNQVTSDGQQHDLAVDLGKLNLKSPIGMMTLGVSADSKGEGSVEIVSMRFEIPPDGKSVELKKFDAVTLTVTDAANKPIPNATVSSNPEFLNYTRSAKTDAAGQATLTPVSIDPNVLSFAVSADGMFPSHPQFHVEGSKASFQVKLFKPTTYSGAVTDETGEPVENATVSIYIEPESDQDYSSHNWNIKSDPQGHWATEAVPDNGKPPYLYARHPDFLEDNNYTNTIPIAKLKDGSAILILKHGVTLTGTVLDPDNKPVAGANVSRGDRRNGNTSAATTDADGHFTFDKIKPEPTELTVTSSKFAPEAVTANPSKPVEIKLAPGNTIKGKVTDDSGKPLASVRLSVSQWRGRGLNWNTLTNAQGEYTWNSAPPDDVLIVFHKQGYRTATATLNTSIPTPTIALKLAQKIAGTVVDAQTNKPIAKFDLMRGDQPDQDQRPTWNRWDSRSFTGGKFQFPVDDQSDEARVYRVVASGYQSAVSRLIKSDELSVNLEFKLEKAVPITATVHLPDGKPAVGADVFIIDDNNLYMRNGQIAQNGDLKKFQTDSAGKFTFTPPPGDGTIAVIGESAFIQIPSDALAKSNEITLQPWGRIEGVVRIGPATAPVGTKVAGWAQNDDYNANRIPTLRHEVETLCDDTGHFVIAKAAPGDYSFGRQLASHTGFTYNNSEPVHVDAGKTTTLTLGGVGRPVTGRIIVPSSLVTRINWQNSNERVTGIRAHSPRPKLPDDFDDWDEATRQKWLRRYYASPEGKADQAEQAKAHRQVRNYAFHVEQDGAFRVDDVVPGKYQLGLFFYSPNLGQPIAGVSTIFTVPEMKTSRSDEPLVLPELTVRSFSAESNAVGQTFPDVSTITLEGSPFPFSSLKGKYVLLDIRNSWIQGNSELKPLRAIQDRYASSGKLALVTIHLDDDPDACKDCVRRNRLTWPQLQLPQTSGYDYNSLGLHSSPDIFLLSPEGKILARDLRGDRIAKAVDDALVAH